MDVRRSRFVLTVLLAVGALYSSNVSGALRAELRPAQATALDSGALQSGELELVLSNTGDRSIEVLMIDLPYAAPKTGAMGPLLSVSSDGVEADFVGIVVNYSDEEVATVSIAPGSVLSIRFDIYRSYVITGGKSYTVSFRSPVRYLDRPSRNFNFTSRRDLEAVVNKVVVDPLTIRTPVFDLDEPGSIGRMSSPRAECNHDQLLEFADAKSFAGALAEDAFTHLQSLYSYAFDPGTGTLVGHFAASSRYVSWFGSHGTPLDPSAMDPVNNTINQALWAIKARISDDQSMPKSIMTATCQCDAADLPPPATPLNTTAWVFQNEPYVVNTCPLFWASPNMPLSRDQNSKVGTRALG